ncbi:hypothetical protein [Streptomyces sp. NBC_01264]|uniref:hypothetical protein n=1 Tax=Streptomyces sp. NBC_01264 TaxID=2903804 RepID=UPI002257F631|nr:hypothetical protein [Streptomyces sp. NBC_01264]MCX4783595.1 hypothetical protein [Streptomyces sp. NBC_01264]
MSDTPRTRARQAELTAAEQRELARLQTAITEAREALAEAAGRIAVTHGRGGNSAVARVLDVTPQHISNLAAAYRATLIEQPAEGSAAA